MPNFSVGRYSKFERLSCIPLESGVVLGNDFPVDACITDGPGREGTAPKHGEILDLPFLGCLPFQQISPVIRWVVSLNRWAWNSYYREDIGMFSSLLKIKNEGETFK